MGVAAEVAKTAAQLEAAAQSTVATEDADPATAGAYAAEVGGRQHHAQLQRSRQ